jgi:hypothetical protein
MTELILGAHLGLLRQRFRPPFPLRGAIGLSTGAGFADNLRALRDGRIGLAKGVIASLSADGLVLDGGERVAADLVVLATGYAYDLSILSPATLAQIVAPDGDFRLYRNIVNPGNPGITFNGYNATTAVPVTSEVAAHWIAGWLDGRVVRPDAPTMEARIDEDLHWRRANFPGGKQFGHFVAPLTFDYLDTLLADLGLPTADASRSQLVRFNAMLNPKDYAFLNGVQGACPRKAR